LVSDRLNAEDPKEMRGVNYGEAYKLNGAGTNQAEGHFFRLRSAGKGQHHHIAAPDLGQRAREKALRERARKGAVWRP
jgi:hypothetical protein